MLLLFVVPVGDGLGLRLGLVVGVCALTIVVVTKNAKTVVMSAIEIAFIILQITSF